MESTPTKIAIVGGAGAVGASAAYALMISGLASEIVLVDVNPRRAEGEAMDMMHGAAFVRPVTVRAGGYADCAGAQIVVITAGAAQKPGESRLDLVRKNTEIFRGMIPQIAAAAPNALLLIVANPVDILTYAALKFSGFPAGRVVGSGTVLDTARLRALIGLRLGIDPRSVHGYVIGEHGDSEVVLWSRATVAGLPISEFCAQRGSTCDSEMQEEIATQVLPCGLRDHRTQGRNVLRHRAGHPKRRRGHAARPKHRTDRLDLDDRSAWRYRHLSEPALRRGSRGCRGRARARDERSRRRGLSPLGARAAEIARAAGL